MEWKGRKIIIKSQLKDWNSLNDKISKLKSTDKLYVYSFLFSLYSSSKEKQKINFSTKFNKDENKSNKIELINYVLNILELKKLNFNTTSWKLFTNEIHDSDVLHDIKINLISLLTQIFTDDCEKLTESEKDKVKLKSFAIFLINSSSDMKQNFLFVFDIKANKTLLEQVEYIKTLIDIFEFFEFDLTDCINLNFRMLQPDYFIYKKKRNTQFRFQSRSLHYKIVDDLHKKYYNETANHLDKKVNKSRINYVKKFNHLYEYILTNNLNFSDLEFELVKCDSWKLQLNKNLSKESKLNLNQELKEAYLKENKFAYEIDNIWNKNKNKNTNTRNYNIVNIIKKTTPDLCVSCYKHYNILDRTFYSDDNKSELFFHYHHLISLSNDKRILDTKENLVKICSTCHEALRRNPNRQNLQIKINKEILDNLKNNVEFKSYQEIGTLKFINIYFKTNDDEIENLAKLLQSKLK